MAKTLSDIQREAELFHYSQENFNLMKECSEINLMENFIERQQFLQENADMFETLMTESYFGEHATTDDDIVALAESVGGKIMGAIKAIGRGIARIFRAIGRFFGLFGDKVESQEAQIKNILNSSVDNVGDGKPKDKNDEPAAGRTGAGLTHKYTFTWDEKNAATMKELIAKYAKSEDGWNIPAQSGGLKIQHVYANVSKNDMANIKNYFDAAMAHGGVNLTLGSSEPLANPTQCKELAEAVGVVRGGTLNKAQAEAGMAKVRSTVKAVGKQHKITFKVDKGYLKQMEKDIIAASSAIENAANKAANKDYAESVEFDETEEFIEAYTVEAVVRGGGDPENYKEKKARLKKEKAEKEKRKAQAEKRREDAGVAAPKDNGGEGEPAAEPKPEKAPKAKPAPEAGVNGKDVDALTQSYQMINKYAANTLKVYNAYMQFRSKVIAAYGKHKGGMGKMIDKEGNDVNKKEVAAAS